LLQKIRLFACFTETPISNTGFQKNVLAITRTLGGALSEQSFSLQTEFTTLGVKRISSTKCIVNYQISNFFTNLFLLKHVVMS